jgi:hypothetical protein
MAHPPWFRCYRGENLTFAFLQFNGHTNQSKKIAATKQPIIFVLFYSTKGMKREGIRVGEKTVLANKAK